MAHLPEGTSDSPVASGTEKGVSLSFPQLGSSHSFSAPLPAYPPWSLAGVSLIQCFHFPKAWGLMLTQLFCFYSVDFLPPPALSIPSSPRGPSNSPHLYPSLPWSLLLQAAPQGLLLQSSKSSIDVLPITATPTSLPGSAMDDIWGAFLAAHSDEVMDIQWGHQWSYPLTPLRGSPS